LPVPDLGNEGGDSTEKQQSFVHISEWKNLVYYLGYGFLKPEGNTSRIL